MFRQFNFEKQFGTVFTQLTTHTLRATFVYLRILKNELVCLNAILPHSSAHATIAILNTCSWASSLSSCAKKGNLATWS